MENQQLLIYGAGGFAREVAWLAETCRDTQYEVVGFIDDDLSHNGEILNNIPIMSLENAQLRFPDASVVSGIGAPRIREIVMAKAANFNYATLIHTRTEMSQFIEMGVGTVICAGNILTTNIRLGQHVQINLDCTIGHDVVMDDYATLAPGVHISGYVHLGKRTYIGTGAVIINGTKDKPLIIHDDAVVGAGACVTKSVPAGVTVVGIPAKPLQKG